MDDNSVNAQLVDRLDILNLGYNIFPKGMVLTDLQLIFKEKFAIRRDRELLFTCGRRELRGKRRDRDRLSAIG